MQDNGAGRSQLKERAFRRVARDPGDPACALPRMDEYLALIKRLDDEDAKSEGSVFGARTNM